MEYWHWYLQWAVVCCCQFTSKYCCRKSNSGRGNYFYREQFYAHQSEVNNAAKIREMRSRRDLPSIPDDKIFQTYQEYYYAHKPRAWLRFKFIARSAERQQKINTIVTIYNRLDFNPRFRLTWYWNKTNEFWSEECYFLL